MAEQEKGPQVSLSGYQPGNEASGLHLMAQGLYDAFLKALRDNDQTGETLRFPVVGVLEGRVGHIGRPGIDKEPSIELRFVAVEPVLPRDTIEGDPEKDVLGLIQQLRDYRLGQQPIEGLTDSPSEPEKSASGGTSTTRKSRKKVDPPQAVAFTAE